MRNIYETCVLTTLWPTSAVSHQQFGQRLRAALSDQTARRDERVYFPPTSHTGATPLPYAAHRVKTQSVIAPLCALCAADWLQRGRMGHWTTSRAPPRPGASAAGHTEAVATSRRHAPRKQGEHRGACSGGGGGRAKGGRTLSGWWMSMKVWSGRWSGTKVRPASSASGPDDG